MDLNFKKTGMKMKTNALKSIELFVCSFTVFLALSTSTFAQTNSSDGTGFKSWRDFPKSDYMNAGDIDPGSSGGKPSDPRLIPPSGGKPVDPQKIIPPKSPNNGNGSVTPVRF
jgi:hypothetical protein